jgi:hypothetical protein
MQNGGGMAWPFSSPEVGRAHSTARSTISHFEFFIPRFSFFISSNLMP